MGWGIKIHTGEKINFFTNCKRIITRGEERMIGLGRISPGGRCEWLYFLTPVLYFYKLKRDYQERERMNGLGGRCEWF